MIIKALGRAVAQIANLDAERQNIASLHSRYVESQRVPELVELSAEERHAKPIERMDWQDALDLARTSKYGKDLSHDDPAVAAGYREVLARRARGE
ncbi:MAG: hypothetical protein WCD25_27200 [Pseudolabrys sp.]